MGKSPVYIEWDDACSPAEGGWQNTDFAKSLKCSPIHSVGWVLKETKTKVIMASGLSPGAVDGVTCIPKVCITRRVTLNIPRQ
jgi:hypothetical protein